MCLEEEANLDGDTEEKSCDDGDRDWREAATSSAAPGAPEAGRGRKDPPLEPLRDTVISDHPPDGETREVLP